MDMDMVMDMVIQPNIYLLYNLLHSNIYITHILYLLHNSKFYVIYHMHISVEAVTYDIDQCKWAVYNNIVRVYNNSCNNTINK
jgi:hypothetical protein